LYIVEAQLNITCQISNFRSSDTGFAQPGTVNVPTATTAGTEAQQSCRNKN